MGSIKRRTRPLAGRVVVVTGASMGIGRAAALALAEAGADLALCSRGPRVHETARAAERLGARVVARRCDVTDPAAVRRWLKESVRRFGRIDVVINNAARLGPRVPLAVVAAAAVARTFDVNAMGALHVTQAALRLSMLRRRRGVIVNIGSGAGRVGLASVGAYCISKFALEAITAVLAKELLGTGVAVCTLYPGVVRTQLRAAYKPDEDPATLPSPESLSNAFTTLACLAPADSGAGFSVADGKLKRIAR